MIRLSIIAMLFLWSARPPAQADKERDFETTLKRVVAALVSRDSVTLSKYTDKRTGIYIINRIGAFDTYKHFPTLGFSDTAYPSAPFYDNVKLTELTYSTLPTFDCEKWSRTGTFVDTTETDNLLSKTATDMNREAREKVSAKTISYFSDLESKSRRVVVADNSNELILYLTYLNNKWVLTMIDKVTADCSV